MPRPPKVHATPYLLATGEERVRLRWHAAGRDQWESHDPKYAALRQNEIERQLLTGRTPLSSAGQLKVRDYAEYYLATKTNARGLRLELTTVKGYRQLLARRICPEISAEINGSKVRVRLGDMQLKQVSIQTVKHWYLGLLQTAPPSQPPKAYRFLHAIFTMAVLEGEIPDNPCRVQGGGAEEEKDRPIPEDPEIIQHLADALANHTDKYGRHNWNRFKAIPLVSGFGGGLRIGEIRGLRRMDVFPDQFMIKVEFTAHDIDKRTLADRGLTGLSRIVKGPKSKASKRNVYLSDRAMAALKEHMATYMPTGDDAKDEDWVFTGPRGGPMNHSNWNLAWDYARRQVGTPPGFTLHDLRHYVGTTMAQNGATLKELMDHMGQSSPRAAMRYQETTKKRKLENRAKMNAAFGPPPDNIVPLRQAN